MNPETEIQQLSTTLGLQVEKQDWGIVNADPARVEEFIRFARHARLSQVQQYAIAELVLASVNEAMADGLFTPEMEVAFLSFLTSDLHGLPHQIRYWGKLSDPQEFPLATFLTARKADN